MNAGEHDDVGIDLGPELTLDDLRTGPSDFDGDAFDWGDRSRSYPHPQYWTV
jgi:hypothetical protein